MAAGTRRTRPTRRRPRDLRRQPRPPRVGSTRRSPCRTAFHPTFRCTPEPASRQPSRCWPMGRRPGAWSGRRWTAWTRCRAST
ncbi:MAG: hypothetical protein E6J05_06475 [Chloroflexi bacterium]|nr:MAG: hypothetical protein E6J05_06475 [Chloroflexota bacterium]